MHEEHIHRTTMTAAAPRAGLAGRVAGTVAGAAEAVEGGITATGLGKRYGDLWALRDLDLHVPAGRVLGLLGHNGAGKTTAVRILATLARPTTGEARVAG